MGDQSRREEADNHLFPFQLVYFVTFRSLPYPSVGTYVVLVFLEVPYRA